MEARPIARGNGQTARDLKLGTVLCLDEAR